MIVAISDFIGEFDLGLNCYDDEVLPTLFEQWEKEALDIVMGCELRINLINDLLNGVPQSQRWIDIFNETFVDSYGDKYCFEGFKNMLVHFIYWKYFLYRNVKPTISGLNKTNSENSMQSPHYRVHISLMYNEFAKQGDLLQKYFGDNLEIFPEYSYRCIPKSSVF